MKTITLQPAPRVDSISDDGTELTQLPYPFHVRENGQILRQDFWKGNPLWVVGFVADLNRREVDIMWHVAIKNPDRMVGMYIVTMNADDGVASHISAVDTVKVHED